MSIDRPLRIMIVEDEALLLMELEMFLESEGHQVVGTATSYREAADVSKEVNADIALVDIHLTDGPVGVELGRYITQNTGTAVVFMTANVKRIPEDFSGAIGVVAKPYTNAGLRAALHYLVAAVRNPPPRAVPPLSLSLAPHLEEQWVDPQSPDK